MQRVSDASVGEAARRIGLGAGASTVERMAPGVAALVESVRVLDQVADHLPTVRYPRTPGYRPGPGEDPLHAWYRKTSIRGSAEGPLAGRRVAVKDTVCVAGVPLMNGASYLEGYVPEVDATIVTRLLDAGAELVGKTNCEYLCFSGESDTNATGPTLNPRRRGYSAGGSSSGSAAVVAAGEVDIAIGGDQGGSIRIPAAWCGAYGMKPTWGLVPYTGVFPVEQTLDHVGPITATVHDNALVLEVLAGADGLDPRQGAVTADSYADAVEEPAEGLRIGVLAEGFGLPSADPRVEEKVRAALGTLESRGVLLRAVSVPMHGLGGAIWAAIVLQGSLEMMMLGDGVGTNWKGLHLDSLARRQAAWRRNPEELPEPIRISMVAGEILRTSFGGRYYHKAQNLARQLAAAYDEALRDLDALALPTVPFTARPIPSVRTGPRPRTVGEPGGAGAAPPHLETDQTVNTAPFNCTGHPALSVPCGTVDGLPVGVMLVGGPYRERTLYRLAAELERAGNWLDW
ncbi:MAG: amidase [Actinomycetota bacterium]|jgi:amidase|nr:amidase [Actinomycetota bacterium]